MKDLIKPCSRIAPFVAHHDIKDHGDLEEETTQIAWKRYLKNQTLKSRKENKSKENVNP